MNEFDFAGQQTDGTGLQYLRARYYDPETGVFLCREPLATGSSWPGNPHGYGGGNGGGSSELNAPFVEVGVGTPGWSGVCTVVVSPGDVWEAIWP